MPWACYRHAMATLQVKTLPDELHAAARARADEQGITLSEYVTRLIRQDVSRPSLAEFRARLATLPQHPDLDATAVMDEVRGQWE